MAIVALTGAGRGDTPYQPQPGGSWGAAWLAGPDATRTAQASPLLRAYSRLPGDAPALVVGDDTGYESYRLTLFLSTMQRTSGATAGAIYNHLPATATGRLDAGPGAAAGPLRRGAAARRGGPRPPSAVPGRGRAGIAFPACQ
ncbi:hypothetical protein [Dactylosporangium sp. NPDC049140]|uniref:hypothetical protein n=1 Tax=Dactylosporangium sp. NPDC049140 TaxID=3155647 RepID=UPI0033F2CC12